MIFFKNIQMYVNIVIVSFQVFIAGDSIAAKSRVSDIIRGCGFTPVDLGALTAARTIEEFILQM